MIHRKTAACLAALIFATSPLQANAQSLEGVKRPEGEARPVGYLPKGSIDYQLLAGPPPTPGSLLDQIDIAVSQQFQTDAVPDDWEDRQLDHATVYPRFAEALGKPIDRQTSPLLVQILNRVMRDAADPVWNAKEAFQRPRPYQRFQLIRRCGSKPPPAPDPEPRGGSSYPSGHTVYGWATALLLAEVAPDRAAAILDRGRDYALSRVVCGYHFPTDTEAARAIATAVLAQLRQSPTFLADLEAARAEYAVTATKPMTVPAADAPAVRQKAEAQAD